MTAITYKALRNFVLQGLSVSNNDISVASADNSFNSSTTDLSGIAANDWILVSGTTSNDGWHQVSSLSVTNKIIVSSTLTDEASGSVITIIGYKHGINISYNLETEAQRLDEQFKAKTNVAESLSGITETLFLNEIGYWNVKTGFITEAQLPYWKEFISSIRAGESFTLDPYGTIASPNAPVSCTLVGDPNITRISTILEYEIQFKAKQL